MCVSAKLFQAARECFNLELLAISRFRRKQTNQFFFFALREPNRKFPKSTKFVTNAIFSLTK